MKLTNDQKKIIEKKLSKFLDTKCDKCLEGDWLISDSIFELREFSGGGLVIGGEAHVFPVLPIICKNCGKTHFFNAVILGLIEKHE